MNLKKISPKLEKMAFYIVILAKFKFTVINDCKGHGAIDFGYPGTYKVILKRQKFRQVSTTFTT